MLARYACGIPGKVIYQHVAAMTPVQLRHSYNHRTFFK